MAPASLPTPSITQAAPPPPPTPAHAPGNQQGPSGYVGRTFDNRPFDPKSSKNEFVNGSRKYDRSLGFLCIKDGVLGHKAVEGQA